MGKVLAFLDRIAVRDAWDLANLIDSAKEAMATAWFRSWFIALSAILTHPLGKYTRQRVEASIHEKAVTEQLTSMLMGDTKLRPENLVDQSWAAISHLMELTEPDAKYIAGIHRGELLTELLFPDRPEDARQAAAHPAILWKLVNVRDHLAKRKR